MHIHFSLIILTKLASTIMTGLPSNIFLLSLFFVFVNEQILQLVISPGRKSIQEEQFKYGKKSVHISIGLLYCRVECYIF